MSIKSLGIWIALHGALVYAVLFAIVFFANGVLIFHFLPGDSPSLLQAHSVRLVLRIRGYS